MRSRYRYPLAWALVCGSLGAGLSVGAQQPKAEGGLPAFSACSGDVSKAEQEAAKGLFLAGRQAYEEGDYPRAIRYWRDAFDLDCKAVVMLRNLANAYERARNPRGAIVCLERYLEQKPDADDAKTVRNRISNLRLELEASKPAAPAASSATAPPAPSPGASSAVGSTISVDSNRGPGAWPWVLTGVGGAALAAGVYLYVDGNSRISDAKDRCGSDGVCDEGLPEERDAAKKGNRGRTFQTIGGASMGVGAAAVAGGLAWYFLTARKRPAATSGAGLWLTPALGPNYGGIGAVGRF